MNEQMNTTNDDDIELIKEPLLINNEVTNLELSNENEIIIKTECNELSLNESKIIQDDDDEDNTSVDYYLSRTDDQSLNSETNQIVTNKFTSYQNNQYNYNKPNNYI